MTDQVGERVTYVTAGVLLVTGGMVAPSVFLNWTIGPSSSS